VPNCRSDDFGRRCERRMTRRTRLRVSSPVCCTALSFACSSSSRMSWSSLAKMSSTRMQVRVPLQQHAELCRWFSGLTDAFACAAYEYIPDSGFADVTAYGNAPSHLASSSYQSNIPTADI
jgi:hypothetical protein